MSLPSKLVKNIEPGYLRLVECLADCINRLPAEGLLLSGGLDTSIIACLCPENHKPFCITVAYRGAPNPDIPFARQVAAKFGLEHIVHYFNQEELEKGISASIKILKSFDPMEIRNSAAAYIALDAARNRGLKSVMTGDGGDELFAGYSFFFDLTPEQLNTALSEMWENMHFSSIDLAASLGIEARLPFLDPDFKTLAISLDSGLKVKSENGRLYGKWILRKAFEKVLSPEIAWRAKAPLEVGTGTTILPALFESRVPDSEFNRKKNEVLEKDGVHIKTKEQLYYYEIFKKVLGIPGSTAGKGRKCPCCGSGVKDRSRYCPTCGEYPI